MIKATYILLLCCATLVFIACGDQIDKKLLPGDWQGVEWIMAGQEGEIDASTAVFSFKPDGQYIYTYNDAVEKGKYYITNNELYTTPDGGTKMMVKIARLTQDSLVFNMNRGGQAETLTLLRKG